ncbi:MAG: TetR/AcrR family transcriptional regulator [Pseudomonadota bacterium]
MRKRGKARAEKILDVAKAIVISEGLASLSTRRVADQLGISVGNLAYYYPTKQALLQAMVKRVIDGYDADLQREFASFPNDPLMRLRAFFRYMKADAKKPEVHAFFYQFWGLTVTDDEAAALRANMYDSFSRTLIDLLRDVHPSLRDRELENMSYAILTFLEGLHVIYGPGDIARIRSQGFDRYITAQLYRLAYVDDEGGLA